MNFTLYAGIVLGAALVALLAYNPLQSLFLRLKRHFDRVHEMENLQSRNRVAVAQINHILAAARQAMAYEYIAQRRHEHRF